MEIMKGRLGLSGPAPGCTGTAACDGIPNMASLILAREVPCEMHARCMRRGTVDAWPAVQVKCAGAEVQTYMTCDDLMCAMARVGSSTGRTGHWRLWLAQYDADRGRQVEERHSYCWDRAWLLDAAGSGAVCCV